MQGAFFHLLLGDLQQTMIYVLDYVPSSLVNTTPCAHIDQQCALGMSTHGHRCKKNKLAHILPHDMFVQEP